MESLFSICVRLVGWLVGWLVIGDGKKNHQVIVEETNQYLLKKIEVNFIVHTKYSIQQIF